MPNEQLPPGRELDARVHTAITGQQVAMNGEDVQRLTDAGVDFIVAWFLPAYSTDLGAAMEAAITAAGGAYWQIEVSPAHVTVLIVMRGKGYTALAETNGDQRKALALSIARAVVDWAAAAPGERGQG